MTDAQNGDMAEAKDTTPPPSLKTLEILARYDVLITPAEISGDFWPVFVEAVMMHPKPIMLHCSGEGGSAFTLYQLIGLIRQHGRFIGVLHADAASAHSILFAACQTRYVSPLGSISVHRCVSSGGWQMGVKAAREAMLRYERMDKLHAQIMADACHSLYDADFWLKAFDDAEAGLKEFDAECLIDMEMARPIAEMPDDL